MAAGDKKPKIVPPATRPITVAPVQSFSVDPLATSIEVIPAEIVSPMTSMPPFIDAAPDQPATSASVPESSAADVESIAPSPIVVPAAAEPINPLSAEVPPAIVAAASVVFPPPTNQPKEKLMTETFTAATDAMKNGAEQIKATLASQTENAVASTKATFEQVASKSREAIEHGMKSVDEIAGMARGNVEAMLASSRAATQGIEAIAREVADFSRKSFEETTAAARAMTTVKTPNELMQLQNDFAKTQFDAAVAEMSKLSETVVKLLGEVFEPVQARATVATDKIKSLVGTINR